MNPYRVLYVSNRYLLSLGYLIHKYYTKDGAFILTVQGLIVVFVILLLYSFCLYEHYARNEFIQLTETISKTIYHCIYIHLFIGILNVIVLFIDSKYVINLSKNVIATLSIVHGSDLKLCRKELFLYYKMFSNTIITACILSYDITIIDLKSLTVNKVLLFVGLLYPHLMIANCLRLFSVYSACLDRICQQINDDLWSLFQAHNYKIYGQYNGYLMENDKISETNSNKMLNCWQNLKEFLFLSTHCKNENILIVMSTVESPAILKEKFENAFENLKKFQKLQKSLNQTIQKQLFLFVLQNTIYIYVTIIIFIELDSEWALFLPKNYETMFYITLSGFICEIFNDYLCLTISSYLSRNEVSKLIN